MNDLLRGASKQNPFAEHINFIAEMEQSWQLDTLERAIKGLEEHRRRHPTASFEDAIGLLYTYHAQADGAETA